MKLQESTNAARKFCLCSSEAIKLITTQEGYFPDFGHHQDHEMGGVWMHPIKLFDGFWLRFRDHGADHPDTWVAADTCRVAPWGLEQSGGGYGSTLGSTPVRIVRTLLAPEEAHGVIVTYRLQNPEKARTVSLEFLARTDLHPVWYSDTAGWQDGEDHGEWLEDAGVFLAKDEKNEWYASLGASRRPDRTAIGQQFGPEITEGRGVSVSLFYDSLSLPADGELELRFFLAGSFESKEDCLAQHARLSGSEDFLASKQARYDALAARCRLTGIDPRTAEICEWIRVHSDWLTVNAGRFGRGLTAGAPEYLWWFGCDSCYAVQGLLATGEAQLARDTLLLLLRYSEQCNGDGRIAHEIVTSGICANPGNTQETAHFLTAIWLYCEWTGDFSILNEAFPYLEKSVNWLRKQDDDGDLFPSGYGIMEIPGLNSELIDTAVYACTAYDAFSKMCRRLGRADQAKEYADLSARVREAVNTELWDERAGLYCDAYTSLPEVESKLSQILGKSSGEEGERLRRYAHELIEEKRALGERESGWLLNRNWVICLPMEMGLAPEEKAQRALETMDSPQFVGPFGAYLDALSHNRMMTISTGALAVSQARYGHPDRALDLLRRMFSTFGMAGPGNLSEMSPDYGCFVQAWTVYAAFVPIVRYFFGIQPDANEGRLVIAPCPPAGWENAALENVPVLGASVSVRFEKKEEGLLCTVEGNLQAPVVFRIPAGVRAAVNGEELPVSGADRDIPAPSLPARLTLLR